MVTGWLIITSIPGFLVAFVLQDWIAEYLGTSPITLLIIAFAITLGIAFVLISPWGRRLPF